jgi:hypothetical protein
VPELKKYDYRATIQRLDSLKLFYVEIPYDALCFFSAKESTNKYYLRLMISINDCKSWHGGVVSLGNQSGYISIKGAILKSIDVKLGDKMHVTLTEDTSEYGMEFLEEFTCLMDQDENIKDFFLSLPMSKRRYILYYVNQVKNSDKRIERAYFMLNKLKFS